MIDLLSGKKVLLMGVLNITPDSFSDGGKYLDKAAAAKKAFEMIAEGADIIDIGGESTRPGAESVGVKEELERVIPVISALRKSDQKIVISIDTNKAEVAEKALEAGASLMNILGGFSHDEKLAEVAAKFKCPAVMYHIKGTPKTMQAGEIKYEDVIEEIKKFFEDQIKIAEKHGIKKENLIFDPGIGFGKTVEQNVEIVRRLKEFAPLPLMIGVSRKSHLGAILKEKLGLKEIPPPNERLEAALAETAIAIQNGARIIRTHDILSTKKFISTLEIF